MAKPKTKTETDLEAYNTARDEARAALNLAVTYLDDGAALDAIRCAAGAISFMVVAKSRRDSYLEVA